MRKHLIRKRKHLIRKYGDYQVRPWVATCAQCGAIRRARTWKGCKLALSIHVSICHRGRF